MKQTENFMMSFFLNSFLNSGKRHLIITGNRGSGKTTLLKELLSEMFGGVIAGITTYAIPKEKVILCENLTGEEVKIGIYVPSDKKSNAMCIVEDGFETLAIPACKRAIESNSEWISIDEIGYLEQSHEPFQNVIRTLFDKKRVIAVIRKQELSFLEELKNREDVLVVDLDELNHLNQKKIGCIIMASGLGKRFGGNKLLAEFRGKTLLEIALEVTNIPSFTQRVVVTRNEEVARICRERNIDVILHTFPNRNDTVRLGVEHMPHMDAWIFCPCDQPLLQKESLEKMVTYPTIQDKTILRLAYGEMKASPVLFGKSYREELCTLPEKNGGGYVMKKYTKEVSFIQAQSPLELHDIDTREDLIYLEK